jgi:hypothetical protein
MKKVLIIVSIFLGLQNTNAQTVSLNAQGFKDFEEFLLKKFWDDRHKGGYLLQLDSLCVTGCSFVSFDVNASGEVTNINTDNRTPPELKDWLVAMVKGTNKKWKVDSKEIKIVVPVIYNFFTRYCKPLDRSYASLLAMSSSFATTTRGELDGIEHGTPKFVYLFSPVLLSSPYY